MIRTAVKLITPPIILELTRSFRRRYNSPVSSEESEARISDSANSLEYIDFWGNTSLFGLQVLQQHGPLKEMRLFSLGNRMAHLADYMGLFGTIYHNTMLETVLPVVADEGTTQFVLLQEDFFDLPPLEVNCVLSHAAIHCLSDSRYGNRGKNRGWQRPYQAAAKLRHIIGDKSVPVIVSIAVHKTESLIDDNARLAHDKFLRSFTESGFSLQEYFFDYLCDGLPKRAEYLNPQFRRAKELPNEPDLTGPYNYVIGNYYFL